MKILSFALLVLSNVRGDHPFDLVSVQQKAEAKVLCAAIVADDCEVLGLAIQQAVDQVFWDAAQTEALEMTKNREWNKNTPKMLQKFDSSLPGLPYHLCY